MGNHEIELIDWLLLNGRKMGVSLQRHDWTDSYLSGLQHITAELKLSSGASMTGSGKAWAEKEAIQKAVAELAERFAWALSGDDTTNGFGAHIDLKLAQRSSFRELLERDLFLGHWFTGMPLFYVSWYGLLSRGKSGERILKALNQEKLRNFEFFCGHTVKCEGLTCIVVAAQQPIYGIHISLALEDDIFDAVEKCFLEIIHNCVFKSSHAIRPLSLVDFLAIRNANVDDHRRLCCDLSFANIAINRMFSPLNSDVALRDDVPLPDYNITQVNLPHHFSDAPLYICRSYSADMQDLFFGSDWRKISFRRLADFRSCVRTDGKASLIPHPLV
ncbi:MAG: hypothetical protein RJB13_2574 [Pseudomonadota bacterium]